MLKDSLVALIEDEEEGCRISRLREDFDEETLEAFDQVMSSGASTRAIWSELQKEGMPVDRALLSQHRFGRCKCRPRPDDDNE